MYIYIYIYIHTQDVFVQRWLRWYLATNASSKVPSVFLPCSYGRIQRQLEFCSAHLGLSSVRFRSHSCRRGGATRLYMRNWPIESIVLFGRWKNVRSCHEYLRKGRSLFDASARESEQRVLGYGGCFQQWCLEGLARVGEAAFGVGTLSDLMARVGALVGFVRTSSRWKAARWDL